MAYAIRLYFDVKLEAAFIGVRTALVRAGVAPVLEALGDRPHVSVVAAEQLDLEFCTRMLERVAREQRKFDVAFAAFGSFPGDQGVVYLAPTPSESLLELHCEVYRRLTDTGLELHEHFRPRGWVPHVTVGFRLARHEVALAICRLHSEFEPIAGKFGGIGLVEYYPITEIATFPFIA